MDIITEFIQSNYQLFFIFLIVILLVVLINEIIIFINLPNGKKKERIIEWLVYACAVAEQIYGSRTGKLKLRYVYNMFIEKFPIISKLISYDRFMELVDEALEKLNEILATNADIKRIITE